MLAMCVYFTYCGTPSLESWFIKHHVISPFGGWDAEKWYYFQT
jgi:hypothetical protein